MSAPQRMQSAKVEWRDGTTIPFLGETVIVVLDARATGAVLEHRCVFRLHRGLARRAAPHAARRPAAHRRARADPRCRAELAAAPGPARVRGALCALRAAVEGGCDQAQPVVGADALGQRERRRVDPAQLATEFTSRCRASTTSSRTNSRTCATWTTARASGMWCARCCPTTQQARGSLKDGLVPLLD